MKHLKFILLISAFTLSGSIFSQKNEGAYKIKIKINGLKDTIVRLANHYGDKQFLKDTAKLDSKGVGYFEGKEKLPEGVYLVVLPKTNWFELIISDQQHFSIETDTTDLVKKMKISGSKENEMFYDYMMYIAKKQAEVEPLRKRMKEIKDNKDSVDILQKRLKVTDDEVRNYIKEITLKSNGLFFSKMLTAMTEVQIPEAPLLPNGKKDSLFAYQYYKAHFFDNIDLKDDRFVRTSFFHSRLKSYFANMILQHPDTIIKEADIMCEKVKDSKELLKYTAWYLTYTYETSQYMGMDAIFVHMSKKYYMSKMIPIDSAQLVKIRDRAMILDPLLIGKKIPSLMLPDTNGNWQSLHDIKAKKTVLIFWEPTCGHCKKEVPALYEIYKRYKEKGIEVFAVNIESDNIEWKKFIKEHSLKWYNVINLFDGNKRLDLKKNFDIYSTPVIYLLDENKIIRAKRIDSENLEQFLKEKEDKPVQENK